MKLQTKFITSFNFNSARIFGSKKTDFSILQFLILYIILLKGFYLYIGITSEGGKLFSPFLSQYANFPGWLSIAITSLSRFLLQLMGYTVYQLHSANITIEGSRGVTLAWACLGAGAMSLWVAFIIAHKASILFKLKWITAGLGLICFVNTLRVAMIALSIHHHWSYIRHFDAHTSFNMVTYAFIVLLMYIFVRRYNHLKKKASALTT